MPLIVFFYDTAAVVGRVIKYFLNSPPVLPCSVVNIVELHIRVPEFLVLKQNTLEVEITLFVSSKNEKVIDKIKLKITIRRLSLCTKVFGILIAPM